MRNLISNRREIVCDDGSYATGKTTTLWLRLRLVENAGFQFVGRVPRREERRRIWGRGCRTWRVYAGRHSSVAPPLTRCHD